MSFRSRADPNAIGSIATSEHTVVITMGRRRPAPASTTATTTATTTGTPDSRR